VAFCVVSRFGYTTDSCISYTDAGGQRCLVGVILDSRGSTSCGCGGPAVGAAPRVEKDQRVADMVAGQAAAHSVLPVPGPAVVTGSAVQPAVALAPSSAVVGTSCSSMPLPATRGGGGLHGAFPPMDVAASTLSPYAAAGGGVSSVAYGGYLHRRYPLLWQKRWLQGARRWSCARSRASGYRRSMLWHR
jgi:hypothetical protein